ncbi:MAG: endonuclease III domain-containing protein [Terriglobales bacterium]
MLASALVLYTEIVSTLSRNQSHIRAFYKAMSRAWGPQHWWPARTRLEVIVGAFLAQNTSWTNVERAIGQLRRKKLLSVAALRRVRSENLESCVRSAGYFRQKARRLKAFIEFLDARYGGSLKRMFAQPPEDLRQQLLALNGVGPETADSILLYAGNHPVFVVDAYTRRILDRHGILPANAPYEQVRALFESALGRQFQLSSEVFPNQLKQAKCERGNLKLETELRGAAHLPSPMSTARRTELAQVLNEMHALIVGVGKKHCLKVAPQCKGCPLEKFLHFTAETQHAEPDEDR